MILYDSGKEYLRTIYLLQKQKGRIREVDIAISMGFSKPSVCVMVKKLVSMDYISINNGEIRLTQKGYSTAKEIYSRFCIIKEYLINEFQVDPVIAEKDASKIEHVLSVETGKIILEMAKRKGM